MKVVELEIYERDAHGDLKFVKRRTYGKVFREVENLMKDGSLVYHYLVMSDAAAPSAEIPEYSWIACYAVKGVTEAHLIHADFVTPDGERKPFIFIKTFHGWDYAWTIAKELAGMLQA